MMCDVQNLGLKGDIQHGSRNLINVSHKVNGALKVHMGRHDKVSTQHQQYMIHFFVVITILLFTLMQIDIFNFHKYFKPQTYKSKIYALMFVYFVVYANFIV
jgi:Ca2+/H+ antiporter